MQQAVLDALLAVGCPREVAARLSTEVWLQWSGDSWPGAQDGEWLLMLNGQGSGFGVDVDRDEWVWAAERVVVNVANDNAEANDRRNRGEHGRQPLWPLPDRTSRR